MTFTYVGTLATDLDKVRFEIGDRIPGVGLRPDGSNFIDEEINAVVSAEGTWGRGAARLCEVLANEWTNEAGSQRDGDQSRDYTKRAELWRQRAKDLRDQYGGGGSTAASVSVTRVDAYSSDIASDEV